MVGYLALFFGVLGTVGAICCLSLLFRLPQASSQALLRGFKDLEHDFEVLSERVASDLGRISRLKRSTLEGSSSPQDGGRPKSVPTASVSRTQLLGKLNSGG